ncbi:MAG: hypothetical protein ABIV47_11095 [Roseiflexaceae bacterium]
MVNHRRVAPSILIAACFFVVFLAAQILIPLAQLVWAPRPARFGWQMYSVASAAPRFELVMGDRGIKPLDITPYVTSLRGDVPLTRFLPPHLCALFPDAAAVRYRMDDGSQAGIYQCHA